LRDSLVYVKFRLQPRLIFYISVIYLSFPSDFRDKLWAGLGVHSKQCWVVSTQMWVKYGQNPNVGLKMYESWSWVKIRNYILNPTFGFVHILPKFGLKQPSIV